MGMHNHTTSEVDRCVVLQRMAEHCHEFGAIQVTPANMYIPGSALCPPAPIMRKHLVNDC